MNFLLDVWGQKDLHVVGGAGPGTFLNLIEYTFCQIILGDKA